MAEWIAEGVPSMDVREVDARRFHRHASSHAYIRRRGIQQYREVYDVIHPNDQFTEPRNLRLSPLNERQRELGAAFFEGAGWERPRWYESNRGLLEGRTWPARGEWEARNWSPINGAEHVATREAVTLMDLSPFVKIRVTGPGALGFLDRLAASRMDRPAGKVTYTVLLDEAGGITSDLTITRLADDDFLLVDGAGTGLRTITRVRDYARAWANGGVRVEDDSSAWACIGMWGPNAQTVMDRVAEEPVTMGRFNAAPVTIAGVPALALRVSYVGEHGWEIYAPTEYAVRLWDALVGGRPGPGDRAGGARGAGHAADREGLPALGQRHPHRVRPVRGRPRRSRSRSTRATSSAATRCCASATRGSAGDSRAWCSTTPARSRWAASRSSRGARRWAT